MLPAAAAEKFLSCEQKAASRAAEETQPRNEAHNELQRLQHNDRLDSDEAGRVWFVL